MARMPRMARTPRMARWLADYPDPIEAVQQVQQWYCLFCICNTMTCILTW